MGHNRKKALEKKKKQKKSGKGDAVPVIKEACSIPPELITVPEAAPLTTAENILNQNDETLMDLSVTVSSVGVSSVTPTDENTTKNRRDETLVDQSVLTDVAAVPATREFTENARDETVVDQCVLLEVSAVPTHGEPSEEGRDETPMDQSVATEMSEDGNAQLLMENGVPEPYKTIDFAPGYNPPSDIMLGRNFLQSLDEIPLPKPIEIISESVQKSTILKDGNGIPLTRFPDGFNIFQVNSGPKDPNIELFSQRSSTHMSSFVLAQDNIDILGAVDFIGDAECFKNLFRSTTNSDAMSFLMHRVGDSIMVDDLSLMHVLWRNTEILGYNDRNGLVDYVRRRIPNDDRAVASFGWRTAEIAENKIAMHHFFYACLNGKVPQLRDVETALKAKRAGKCKWELPEQGLAGLCKKFLSTNLWTLGERTFLIGSNVPTFLYESDSDEDEPFMNCLTTLGIHTPDTVGEDISEWNGVDMWFNNVSLGAGQTYLAHQEECLLLRTELIKTDDIPKRTNVDVHLMYSRFQNLLDGIEECLDCRGSSYWLYRAPGSDFIEVHDVSTLLRDNSPEIVAWPESLLRSDFAFALKRSELVKTLGKPAERSRQLSGSDSISSGMKRKKSASCSDAYTTILPNGTTTSFLGKALTRQADKSTESRITNGHKAPLSTNESVDDDTGAQQSEILIVKRINIHTGLVIDARNDDDDPTPMELENGCLSKEMTENDEVKTPETVAIASTNIAIADENGAEQTAPSEPENGRALMNMCNVTIANANSRKKKKKKGRGGGQQKQNGVPLL